MPSSVQTGTGYGPETVEDALAFIHGLYRYGSVPGLLRVERLLELLGNPHAGVKIVHVAGTNGKGSVTAMLDAVLRASGYRTGRFISPYIERFGERITVDGREISGAGILSGIQVISPLLDRMLRDGYEHPTEFEVVTALGMWYFAQKSVDVVVLEVGLGGRLDATNVVAPADLVAAVITNIGHDHVAQLGPTLADIAREKAGIIKPGRPVITAVDRGAARAVIETRCRDEHAPLSMYGKDFRAQRIAAGLSGQAFSYEDDRGVIERLMTPLLGAHQVVNAACAVAVTRSLQDCGFVVDLEALRAGLKRVSWPCRFEVVCEHPPIIIDAAHNPEGIIALRQSVQELIGERVVLITGMLTDKPTTEMVGALAEIVETVVLAAPPSSRAADCKVLKKQFAAHGISSTVAESPAQAVEIALALSGGSRGIVCAGSCYLAGPVRQEIAKRGLIRRNS